MDFLSPPYISPSRWTEPLSFSIYTKNAANTRSTALVDEVSVVFCLPGQETARRGGEEGRGKEAEETGSVLALLAGSAFRLHGGNSIPGAG